MGRAGETGHRHLGAGTCLHVSVESYLAMWYSSLKRQLAAPGVSSSSGSRLTGAELPVGVELFMYSVQVARCPSSAEHPGAAMAGQACETVYYFGQVVTV